MKKLFILFFILFFTVGTLLSDSLDLKFNGAELIYTWDSDASEATEDEIENAIQQGLDEGYKDGLLDKDDSWTTHYGDSYSRYSFDNDYVQERYHDAYMEGYKSGAGKPPSIDDIIYW
jgi:hypothetical protein